MNEIGVQRDGSISTCCHTEAPGTGDIKRTPFRQIWNGGTYENLMFVGTGTFNLGAALDVDGDISLSSGGLQGFGG